jgi:hypothetical protein
MLKKITLARCEIFSGFAVPVIVSGVWPEGNSYTWYFIAPAWGWLLLGPCLLKPGNETRPAIISMRHLRYLTLLMALFFILVACFHSFLGNYVLWAKVIYFTAFTSRFMAAAHLSPKAPGYLLSVAWLSVWAIIVYTVMIWNPDYIELAVLPWLAGTIVLWVVACVFFIQSSNNPDAHTLYLYLVFLGPLPSLALAWTEAACWILAFIFVILLCFFKLGHKIDPPELAGKESVLLENGKGELWFPLWLFRSALILWWCLGCGLMLSLSWWVPRHEHYFQENAWIKAFGLGLFLLICLGLLLEYSLPLLGRPEPKGRWRRDKSWGPALSACAALLALTPALWLPSAIKPDNAYLQRADIVVLDKPAILNRDNDEINIPVPESDRQIKRVYIISRLQDGSQIVQTQAVAMLAIIMRTGLPNFHYLRAGIDTAEQDLSQIRVKTQARHQAPALAGYQPSFSADGQAYQRQNYLTGFFLNTPGSISSINLHYMPPLDYVAGEAFPQLIVEKIFLE